MPPKKPKRDKGKGKVVGNEPAQEQQPVHESNYDKHLRDVHQLLYAKFDVLFVGDGNVRRPHRAATRVDDKFRPRYLRPLKGFEDVHTKLYEELVEHLRDHDFGLVIETLASILPRSLASEDSTSDFIKLATLNPAAKSASAYLKIPENAEVNEERVEEFYFDADRVEQTFGPVPGQHVYRPDIWGIGTKTNGQKRNVLPGEHKAAHALTSDMLKNALSAPPKDFFDQVTKVRPESDTEQSASEVDSGDLYQPSEATSEGTPDPPESSIASRTRPFQLVSRAMESLAQIAEQIPALPAQGTASEAGESFKPGSEPSDEAPIASGSWQEQVFVGKAMCQSYDSMIQSGLAYGYLSSGNTLVLLHVPEEHPEILEYYWREFPTDLDCPPRDTLEAHLVSWIIMAARTEQRSEDWIRRAFDILVRWSDAVGYPRDADNDQRGSGSGGGSGNDQPDNGSGDGADGGQHDNGSGGGTDGGQHDNGSGGGTDERPAKRPRPNPDGTRSDTVESPKSYCTQACLCSLSINGPLDNRCPNVALHRAAGHGQNDRHPLTAQALCARVVAQLTKDAYKDCKCLELYGRYGSLFRIVVTGYGYALVAKGVRITHRKVLEREEAVYKSLASVQGRYIPVFLGIADLKKPLAVPQMLDHMRHMMLMSYAGPMLALPETRKMIQMAGRNPWTEERRTIKKLRSLGLFDKDIREENMAWNAEARRVMQLDFDMAEMRRPKRRVQSVPPKRWAQPVPTRRWVEREANDHGKKSVQKRAHT